MKPLSKLIKGINIFHTQKCTDPNCARCKKIEELIEAIEQEQ